MKSRPARFTAVALFVVTLTGCYLFPKEEKVLAPPLLAAPEVTYSTVQSRKGTIEAKTTVTADFVPAQETALFFRSGGNRLKRLAVMLGDDVKAGALIAELDTGSLENRIAQQKILLRKAQVVNERTALLSKDRFEKELAGLDVELASLQLTDLQQQLEESRLFAPTAGSVVYTFSIKAGDLVEAYKTVARIADPKNLNLLYKGEKSGDFRVGAAVSIQLTTGRTVPGVVVMAPGSTPTDVTDELRGAVVVKPGALPPGVKYGDSASVTRVMIRKDNVIVIPHDLVHTYLGRDFVQVMDNGVMKEKTIELGVQTPTDVEVVKGLAVGEDVLSR
jgi:membrane fusion protein, macrolide-specific efflux system